MNPTTTEALMAAPQIPLWQAYLCEDCKVISTLTTQCPACGCRIVSKMGDRTEPQPAAAPAAESE